MISRIESRFERGLFAARWLMAPMYLGLVVALAMLVVVFIRETAYYAPKALVMTSEDAILAILTLIDLTLAANLLLIVLFSGYETFVSKLEVTEDQDRPAWMGKVDFSGLKLKLVASIVAISGISLLKRFMEIGEVNPDTPFDPVQLRWMVFIHITFVVSGVLLALMDWLTVRSAKA
jgi:uncharacterized protein (TIGR00645 family)